MPGWDVRHGRAVSSALRAGRPLVALESTIVAHGLPWPDNLRVARETEQAVRDAGATPATIGVIAGQITVGLDEEELARLAKSEDVLKLSPRDLAPAVVAGADGATTVASTSVLAVQAGIGVFATGGLGGVHRQAHTSFDESADLITLRDVPICVVCAGVKSILDVPATLERLETFGVTVLGYRTRDFPGFYLANSGSTIDWSVDTPEEAARVFTARRAQRAAGATVVANPLPESEQLDPGLHDRVLAEGLARAEAEGVAGKQVTPYLLAYFHRATGGASLKVNERIILRNAQLAARIAVAAGGSASDG
ncbi:MAG: pseudouridine-5'-phosphate glycosidase [Micromonosporaceae bacterium]